MIVGGLPQPVDVLAPQMIVGRSGERVASWLAPWVSATVQGWIQPRSGRDNEVVASTSTLHGRAFLPVGVVLGAESRLRDAGGRVWRLDGPPLVKWGLTGPDHVEVDVVSVEVFDGTF